MRYHVKQFNCVATSRKWGELRTDKRFNTFFRTTSSVLESNFLWNFKWNFKCGLSLDVENRKVKRIDHHMMNIDCSFFAIRLKFTGTTFCTSCSRFHYLHSSVRVESSDLLRATCTGNLRGCAMKRARNLKQNQSAHRVVNFSALGLQMFRRKKTNPSPAVECRRCCWSSCGSYLSNLPYHRLSRLSCHRPLSWICRARAAFDLSKWTSWPICLAALALRAWCRSELPPTSACRDPQRCMWWLELLVLGLFN